MMDNDGWWVGRGENGKRVKSISSLGQHFCLFQHLSESTYYSVSVTERLKETPPLKVSLKEKEKKKKGIVGVDKEMIPPQSGLDQDRK